MKPSGPIWRQLVRVAPVLLLVAACFVMVRLPGPVPLSESRGTVTQARVLEVDDSDVMPIFKGVQDFGTQRLKVELDDGRAALAYNEIRCQPEFDKKFRPGDIAQIHLSEPDDGDERIAALNHWRLGWMAVLFVLFSALLAVFGGWTGIKALFSFVFSCFTVWKLLIPLCLSGWNAAWVAFAVVSVLTAVIMYLVAGPTRKGVAAFLGAMLGVAASLGLAFFFTAALRLDGVTMPHVLELFGSGRLPLVPADLADIFVGAVILASSGAVMDLAMDIASGVEEVARHNPALPRRQLFMSGVRIGRSVVGTMTTTLLLAYSGGYLTLLMRFAHEGTSPLVFLNTPLVASEIVKTLVGSFGLVLVAPFTAFVAAWVCRRNTVV